ncbi:hypothetical protein V1514DRAFT_339345 [Lipomyces japonicus]|uniref:uncharacterized protein n=1 Tax=Lipomyces japonicus TaxID=56871 RepID=UPI0034CDE01A
MKMRPTNHVFHFKTYFNRFTFLRTQSRQFSISIWNRYSEVRETIISNNKLPKSCPSCGARTQINANLRSPGGYLNQKTEHNKSEVWTVKKSLDKTFLKFTANLPQDVRLQLLSGGLHDANNFGSNLEEKLDVYDNQLIDHKEVNNTKLPICYRCHHIFNQNDGDLQPKVNYEQIFGELPDSPDLTIVHVIDAYDMPLSILPLSQLLSLYKKKASKVIYAINRVDLLVNNEIDLNQKLIPYMTKLLQNTVKIQSSQPATTLNISTIDNDNTSLWNLGNGTRKGNTEICTHIPNNTTAITHSERVANVDIHFVSARVGWGLDKLLRTLPSNSYLIGRTNVGKSSLIRSLQRFTGPASLIGPGESFFPGMTRAKMDYTFKVDGKRKVLYDLPGVEDCTRKIWPFVKASKMKSLVKAKFFDKKNRDYQVIKRGQCLNIGGLVLIESPECNIIAWDMIGKHGIVEAYVNSNIDKAKEVIKKQDQSIHLAAIPDACDAIVLGADLRIDGGGADIVISDLGYVELRVSGKVQPEGAKILVHIIGGANVTIRRPFFEQFKIRKRKATHVVPKKLKLKTPPPQKDR